MYNNLEPAITDISRVLKNDKQLIKSPKTVSKAVPNFTSITRNKP
jgi:hypothetical protein